MILGQLYKVCRIASINTHLLYKCMSFSEYSYLIFNVKSGAECMMNCGEKEINITKRKKNDNNARSDCTAHKNSDNAKI
jgi:hypothetical protein